MDSTQESPLQKGKKRKRTALTEKSERFSEDSADLPHKHSRTAPNTKKKACLSQTLVQANIGIQRNRTILEVLKICSPTDVLKSLSLVNRHWMETCSSNELSKELWSTFLEDLYIPPDTSTHPKTTCASYTRQQQTVVDLRIDRMEVLNKATGVWTSTKLSEPFQIDRCAYALLFDGSLLCCGGMRVFHSVPNFYKRAYRVAFDGKVSALEPMIHGRCNPGLAAYGRKVFVFGGRAPWGYSLTTEVYNESSWLELPTMLNKPHSDFVPCIYKRLIYLCSSNSRSVEVFNPESLAIELLAKIKIPDWISTATACIEGRLVSIGATDVWRWDFERKDSEVSSKPRYVVSGVSLRTVLHCNLLYLITDETRLMINMKTFSRRDL